MAAAEHNRTESQSLDFGFAFNDANFSDRIMRIEILSGLSGPERDSDDSLGDCTHTRKRRRVDPVSNANDDFSGIKKYFSDCKLEILSRLNTFLGYMSSSKIPVANDNEPSTSTECSGVEVRTLHVSSPILAANSPFFYKLFSNGMMESHQRHVTLQIQASEEDAVMDMLNFMYSNTLPRTTPIALLNVFTAADKFEVASCMRYCSRLLHTLPMTCKSALFFLNLPSMVSMPDTVEQLREDAKKFFADRFEDLTKYEDEILKLPLACLDAFLSSDDLKVPCEDDVYKFVLKWAQLNYPKLEDRREILNKHIIRLVRFPFMSLRQLKKVLTCGEIESQLASKVVLDALLFKAEPPHRSRCLAAENANANSSFRQFVERPYRYIPVKVFEPDLPLPNRKCLVYVSFKRGECVRLFPSGQIYSQAFHLGEKGFVLSGHVDHQRQPSHCFDLFLSIHGKGEAGLTVDYDCATIVKDSKDFVTKWSGSNISIGGKDDSYHNILSIAWTDLMAEDSPYFIHGALHFKVKLTVMK